MKKARLPVGRGSRAVQESERIALGCAQHASGDEEVDLESAPLANGRKAFRVPCACPEGATGESPGWNAEDHATQRPLCPERAHGKGGVGSTFAPLGRGVVGGVTQGSAPLHPGLSPCAALRRGEQSQPPDVGYPLG
jgi:hypothetical protein